MATWNEDKVTTTLLGDYIPAEMRPIVTNQQEVPLVRLANMTTQEKIFTQDRSGQD